MGDNDFEVGKLTAAVEMLTTEVSSLRQQVESLNNFKVKIITIYSLICVVVSTIVPLVAKAFAR